MTPYTMSLKLTAERIAAEVMNRVFEHGSCEVDGASPGSLTPVTDTGQLPPTGLVTADTM